MQSVLFWMCFLISISANFGFFRWGPLQLLRIFLVLEWWILRSSFVSGRATSFLGPKLVLTRRLCGNNFWKSWILVFFCWADSDFGKISSSLDALILTCSGLVRDEREFVQRKFFLIEVSNFMGSFQTCFFLRFEDSKWFFSRLSQDPNRFTPKLSS